jgi:hypothetical protein
MSHGADSLTPAPLPSGEGRFEAQMKLMHLRAGT